MQTPSHLVELKARYRDLAGLKAAAALMGWDEATYMPENSGPYRGDHISVISRLHHEKATDPALGKILEQLSSYEKSLPFEHDDAAFIRVAREDFSRATRVPAQFVEEMSAHSSHAYQTWKKARSEKNFKMVQDILKKKVDLSRKLASFYPEYQHPNDALIAEMDPGFKVETLQPLFQSLRQELVPLFKELTSQGLFDNRCLKGRFEERKQWAFGETVIKKMGYDFKRGRQDKTAHPFMTRFSAGDVRITTRVNEADIVDALFSTIHEAGHALYELGVKSEFEATSLGGGTSAAVHESQSRLWENLVGRSFEFWQHFYPHLQEIFPDQLHKVELVDFYKAINRVEGSLIRTDADEVTYNLHVMIRFDLECSLLEGKIKVEDLPELWDARYESDLGVRSPDVSNGVLQDVHWFAGTVGGYFQSYTLGNIMSGQFFEKALKEIPDLRGQFAQGQYSPLRNWLQSEIHQHGRKFEGPDLVRRVTGKSLEIAPYVQYLKTKYRHIMSLK